MPRVPQYFRNKLASSQTGVGSADQSGVIIGKAVQNLADTFFTGVMALEAKQKQYVDESRRTKIASEYSSELMEQTDRIRTEYSDRPEEALDELNKTREEMRQRYTLGLDGGLQQTVGLDLDKINAEASINDTAWKIGQNNKIIQQNHIDRINADAKFLAKGASFQDYLSKAQGVLDDTESFSQAFGGVAAGREKVNTALDAYTKAYVTSQLENGKAFEVGQQLDRGDFDPFMSGKNVKGELLGLVQKARDGQEKKTKFMGAVRAVTEGFDASDGILSEQMSLPDIEERASQLSFEMATRELSDVERERMGKQLNILTALRDFKLEYTTAGAVDDMTTKADLLARYQMLVSYDDNVNTLEGTLDEVLDFQRDATAALYEGKLSEETYRKWMLFTKTAIQNDITGVMKQTGSGFKMPGGFLGGGDNKKLATSKQLRRNMADILENVQPAQGADYAVDVVEFYMDDLYDKAGGDLGQVEMIASEEHKNMLTRAKLKASLKKLGLPVYLTVGDRVPAMGGVFTIEGIDVDGTPLVDVTMAQ